MPFPPDAPARNMAAQQSRAGYVRVTLSRVIWLMFSAPTCRLIVVNSLSDVVASR